MAKETRPIIIKRVVEGAHGGHHGGAWKVAYADFVTAMMAFFLLLWLISSASEDTLKGLAEFFSDATVNTGPPGGLGGQLDGITMLPGAIPGVVPSPFDLRRPEPSLEAEDEEELPTSLEPPRGTSDGMGNGEPDLDGKPSAALERRRLDAAQAAILSAVHASPELRRFKRHLLFDETSEGLRLQIVDRARTAMFPVGSDTMYPHTRELLQIVVQALAGLENRVSIRGHTDSLPFKGDAGYDNWRLSSDRANATREAMVAAGFDPSRVDEVVGKADAERSSGIGPEHPSNRRISIVILHDNQDPSGNVRSGKP